MTLLSDPVWTRLVQSLRTALFFLFVGRFCAAQSVPVDVAWAIENSKAEATHSPLDIGTVASVFDGNVATLARTASVNPMVITLHFTEAVTLESSRIYHSAGSHRWRIEAANSLSDLDQATASYRLLLDWQTGTGNQWIGREVTQPGAYSYLRLSLQRVSGDNYVHLYEWQLFEPARPFSVSDVQRSGQRVTLGWPGTPGQWYAVQASSDLKQWTDIDFRQANSRSVAADLPGNPASRYLRVRTAAPEERSSIVKKVLVVNLDPIIESAGGIGLNQLRGWGDPHAYNAAYLSDLTAASGGYVRWEVAHWVDLDLWPVKTDGFAYDDASYLHAWSTGVFHSPDSVSYETLLDLPLASLGNRSAHQLAASGDVDEVIYWGFPYSGFYESRMVGRTAYWCNAPELIRPSRLYVVMGLNPEAGSANALHSFGHRTESILWKVFGSWSGTGTVNHLWDRFTRVGPRHAGAIAGCGNVHYPPNANADYEYGSSLVVPSEADNWLHFPDLSGATQPVSAATWGGPDYHGNFMRWWFTRIPKAPGRYVDAGNATNNGKLNNWWGYIVDMNEYAESR